MVTLPLFVVVAALVTAVPGFAVPGFELLFATYTETAPVGPD
jgi:hypothetical protein